jgi:hypothetical protein
VTDLSTEDMSAETNVTFTLFRTEQDRWEGKDFSVRIAPAVEPAEEAITEVRSIRRTRITSAAILQRRIPRSQMREQE